MPALPAPAPASIPASMPPLHARQSNPHGSIPTTYGALYSSPHPGVVSGIVLACIGGYLLVIWLIYTVLNIGPPVRGDAVSTYLGGESVVTLSTVRRSRSRRPPRPVRVRERVEVRRRSGGRPGPEIVEEPSESSVFMGGGRSRGRGGRTVSTVSDEDDFSDEIVVEEVGRRRRGSRRRSRRRSPSYYEESGGSSLAY